MTDYQPIACGAYDELEILAMRRVEVQVELVGGSLVTGRVVDTSIHDGGEFLVLESAGERHELRLDRIAEIRAVQGESLWRQKTDNSD